MIVRALTIASPDKISLGMFSSFLSSAVGAGFQLINLHYLASTGLLESTLNDFHSSSDKAIFRFYAGGKNSMDPMSRVPAKLMEVSDAVVWFDRYSTEYKLLKDTIGFDGLFKESWKIFLGKISLT